MNLSTRLLVSGTQEQLRSFHEAVSRRLDLVEDFQPGPYGSVLYWVEVLRLQGAIRQAREFGLEASESVPKMIGGGE